MMDATRPDIEQIQARAEAATPGPWEWATDKGAPDYVQLYSTAEIDEYEADILSADGGGDVLLSAADADFIAHARTDISDLLAAIDELTAQLAAYAEQNNALKQRVAELKDIL